MSEITAASFKRVEDDSYGFNQWVLEDPVSTSFGDFEVEARTSLGDQLPPDDRMLADIHRLIAYVRQHEDAVLEKIWEHYQLVSRNAGWMGSCGVPLGLGRQDLAPYLTSLDIASDRDEEEPTILVTPQWDEEHALYLTVRENQLVLQNA